MRRGPRMPGTDVTAKSTASSCVWRAGSSTRLGSKLMADATASVILVPWKLTPVTGLPGWLSSTVTRPLDTS